MWDVLIVGWTVVVAKNSLYIQQMLLDCPIVISFKERAM